MGSESVQSKHPGDEHVFLSGLLSNAAPLQLVCQHLKPTQLEYEGLPTSNQRQKETSIDHPTSIFQLSGVYCISVLRFRALIVCVLGSSGKCSPVRDDRRNITSVSVVDCTWSRASLIVPEGLHDPQKGLWSIYIYIYIILGV